MEDSTVVIYTTHTYNSNVEFFMTNGIFKSDKVYFIIVLNMADENEIYSHINNLSNVTVIVRENEGPDFEAWNYALNMVKSISFNKYIFINSSCRGPFVFENDNWTELFTSQLNDEVKLVGPSINYSKDNGFHVQSFAFATDGVGLQLLKNNQIFGDNVTYSLNNEIKMSVIILKNNYKLQSLIKIPFNIIENDIWVKGGLDTFIDIHEAIFVKNGGDMMLDCLKLCHDIKYQYINHNLKAIYGGVDVTKKLYKVMNGPLVKLKGNYNDIFGDTKYGEVKHLEISSNAGKWTMKENEEINLNVIY